LPDGQYWLAARQMLSTLQPEQQLPHAQP